MHIALDSPLRLRGNTHYFQYKGIRFKLIQNDPRKWSDVLVTIRDSYGESDVTSAFAVAGEFASALSWHNRVGISVRHVGGPGVPKTYRLRQARCSVRVFPVQPFRGLATGFTLAQIAHIENAKQSVGTTLYREAKSSNKSLLAILLYWQILEVLGNDPVGWVNRIFSRHRGALAGVDDYLQRLPLHGRRLGDYLLNDCRDAIAHIRRKPGRTALKFNDENENSRLGLSERVLEALATIYIQRDLDVTSSLTLARRHGREFPAYVDSRDLVTDWYVGVS